MSDNEEFSDSMNGSESLDREANNGGSDREETSQARDAQGEGEDVLLEQGPQPNMEFESRESLFNAYQNFAKTKGFCVAIRNCRDDKYIMISFDRGQKTDVKKHTKRVDCHARINAKKLESGYWRVTTVQSVHNHDLDPTFSVFMAPHRSISINMKRQLEKNDLSSLRPCQTIKLLQVKAGGSRNLGCTPKDCRNFIDERRRLRLGEGDAAAIHELFLRLQQKDRNFFHLMDIDDRSRLRNVMWIHPPSRAAYEDFSDVVSFDTTYCLNRYEMPLATMIGVNHHHQSMLLGCALLTHEQADSFRWFFTNWLEAMGGVQPKAILTDQCESINIALREIMPNTIHRFCIWHIVSKIGQKFKGLKDFTTISSAFKFIIYNSLSIDDFESRWADFLVKYNMSENEWLKSLYEVRAKWVPVYLVEYFWAGMVSTQRSESMNAFFDHYITPKSTLKIFVEQYEIAISNKIEKELHAEYQSKCTYIKRRTKYEWEEQFGSAYTNNTMNYLKGRLDEIRKELVLFNDPEGSEIDLANPKITRRRGRPRKKRFKSDMEISQSRGKSSSSKGRGHGRGRGCGRGNYIDGGQGDGVIGTQGSVIH